MIEIHKTSFKKENLNIPIEKSIHLRWGLTRRNLGARVEHTSQKGIDFPVQKEFELLLLSLFI